jgi:hypothetical protein
MRCCACRPPESASPLRALDLSDDDSEEESDTEAGNEPAAEEEDEEDEEEDDESDEGEYGSYGSEAGRSILGMLQPKDASSHVMSMLQGGAGAGVDDAAGFLGMAPSSAGDGLTRVTSHLCLSFCGLCCGVSGVSACWCLGFTVCVRGCVSLFLCVSVCVFVGHRTGTLTIPHGFIAYGY